MEAVLLSCSSWKTGLPGPGSCPPFLPRQTRPLPSSAVQVSGEERGLPAASGVNNAFPTPAVSTWFLFFRTFLFCLNTTFKIIQKIWIINRGIWRRKEVSEM